MDFRKCETTDVKNQRNFNQFNNIVRLNSLRVVARQLTSALEGIRRLWDTQTMVLYEICRLLIFFLSSHEVFAL